MASEKYIEGFSPIQNLYAKVNLSLSFESKSIRSVPKLLLITFLGRHFGQPKKNKAYNREWDKVL